jgi:2'-5' RNA ligase
MSRLRLFFAAELPASCRAELAGVQDALVRARESGAFTRRSDVRFVDPESLHVTLHFLGSGEESQLPALEGLLRTATADLPAITTTLQPLTAFSKPLRARVLVVPLADSGETLTRLALALQRGAEALGFPAEPRAFRPHVTLARLPRPADARSWVECAPELALPVTIHRVVLYRSEATPRGSRYHPLLTAVLGQSPPKIQ